MRESIPLRVSSLLEANRAANLPAGSHSTSIFADGSIGSSRYPPVASELVFSSLPRGSNLRFERGPSDQVYEDDPAVPRGRVPSVEHDFQQSFMVDDQHRVIRPASVEAQPVNGVFRRISCRLRTTEWTETAKATYLAEVSFHRKISGSNGVDERPMPYIKQGTAVHIGEGLFLTNLHVTRWDSRYSPDNYVAIIWLQSGSGRLDGLPLEFPSAAGRGTMQVEVVAWPAEALNLAGQSGMNVVGGLMHQDFQDYPKSLDFVLMKTKSRRWKATMRSLLGNRSFVLPASVRQAPTVFPATLVCINGAFASPIYDNTVNTAQHILNCTNALLPGVVSYVSTQNATKSQLNRMPWTFASDPTIIRYPLGTAGGSNGSGLYLAPRRLIGIHTGGELDPTTGPQRMTTRPDNQSTAVCLQSISFKEFIRNSIIPALTSINTFRARQIVEEWRAIL